MPFSGTIMFSKGSNLMQVNEFINKFCRLLEHEADLYEELLAVIEKEKQAVVATNLAELNESAKVKDNLLLKLRILDEQRQHQLRLLADDLKQPVEELNLSKLAGLVDAPHVTRLNGLQSTLVTIIGKIQQANERNRALFSHSLELVRSSMNLLNNVMTSTPVYFPSGNLQHSDQTGKILQGEV
jgi:flagellar biosynthesis/type III secretory pathway chaperone